MAEERPLCEAIDKVSEVFGDKIASNVKRGLEAKWSADSFKTFLRDDLLFLSLLGSIKERFCELKEVKHNG